MLRSSPLLPPSCPPQLPLRCRFLNAGNTFNGNVAAGSTGPGFMFDLTRDSALRYQSPALFSDPGTCNVRIPGWTDRGPRTARGTRVIRALARIPFDAFSGNMAHSTRVAYWIGGIAVMPPFDNAPLNVLSGNAAYRSFVQGVDQFEPAIRMDRMFNYK